MRNKKIESLLDMKKYFKEMKITCDRMLYYVNRELKIEKIKLKGEKNAKKN